MATVEELLVLIDATTEGLRKEMKRGADETEKFRKRVNRSTSLVQKRFDALGKSLKRTVAGFAAALSVRAIVQFGRSAIATGDNIGKAAATAGIAVEQLQELRFAFGQLGGTMDREVDESIRRFNRRIGLAIQGQGEAVKVAEQLGLAFRDQGGNILSTGTILEEAIQKLSQIEDDSIRAARASAIFGEDSGPRLAAAIGKGVDAMDALRETTPGVLSAEQVQKAENLTDAFDRMARKVGGELKAAFIDATFAFAKFLKVPETFNLEEAQREIEAANLRIAQLRLSDPNNQFSFTQDAIAEQEALIAALELRLNQLRTGTSALLARLGAEFDTNTIPGTKTSLPTNVGAELLAGMGDVRAGSLEIIPTETATAFNLQLQQMRDHVDDVRNSVLTLDETTEERTKRMEQTWETLGNAVGFTLRTQLSNVFLGVESDWRETIKRMIADWLVQKALLGIGNSIGGGFGSFINGVFGNRQHGGHVAASRPYVVGEAGPELFVPGSGGSILSNRQADLSGSEIIINQVNRFDVGLETVQGQIAAMTPRIAQETQHALMRALNRPRMA